MKHSVAMMISLLRLTSASSNTISYEYGYGDYTVFYRPGGALLPSAYSVAHRLYQQPYHFCNTAEQYARMLLNDPMDHSHLGMFDDSHFGINTASQTMPYSDHLMGMGSSDEQYARMMPNDDPFGHSHLGMFDDSDFGINTASQTMSNSDGLMGMGSPMSGPRIVRFNRIDLPTSMIKVPSTLSPLIHIGFKNKVISYFALCVLTKNQLSLKNRAQSCQQLRSVLIQGRFTDQAVDAHFLHFDCPSVSVILDNRIFTVQVLQKAMDIIDQYERRKAKKDQLIADQPQRTQSLSM